jgi:hypothetical protein
MIKKKIVSIIIPATKLDDLKKCLSSIYDNCVEKEIQVIVTYSKENREIKQYIKKEKKKHHIVSYGVNLMYAYVPNHLSAWMKKIAHELKFQKRKEKSVFISNVVVRTALYNCGEFFARGEYVLYLSEEMRLTKNFWKTCVEPLKNQKQIGVEVILANQIGKYAVIDKPLYDEKKKFSRTKGTREVLFGLHAMSYAVIWKRKKLRETKKYIEFTTADAYYFMEMNLLIRMQEAETMVISDGALDCEVSKKYKKSFDNIKYPVERLAFLRGLRRYFGTIIVRRKIDISELVHDIDYCENDYQDFLDYMILYYEKKKESITAERYKNLKKSLLLVME